MKPANKPNEVPAAADRFPAWRCKRTLTLTVLGFAVLLVGDLLLKDWMDGSPGHRKIVLIPKLLALTYVENPGAIFGLMEGRQFVFVVASIAATVFIGFFFARSDAKDRLTHVSLAMILAGNFGNLYDRVRFGSVRDMLWLFPEVNLPFGWSWPEFLGGGTQVYPWIFNLADVYLLVGICLLLIHMWVTDLRQARKQAEANEKTSPAKS